MAEKSSIEWTDATWNPVRGCSRVSEGCRNCYAEKIAARFSDPGQSYEGLAKRGPARWTRKVRLVEGHLSDPLRWKRPRRIFVNSMSDLFHEGVSDETIDRIFAVMALAPQHTFQILTKRPERMRAYLSEPRRWSAVDDQFPTVKQFYLNPRDGSGRRKVNGRWVKTGIPDCPSFPLPNVWLGVSVEDQQTAGARIPLLLQTPAAVRFISAEPLLGPVDLTNVFPDHTASINALTGEARHLLGMRERTLGMLDWVIVGGESGSGARPFNWMWADHIVRQCKAAGVACFVKQLGSKPLGGMGDRMPLKDRKGGDMNEWPADLRVRELPAR